MNQQYDKEKEFLFFKSTSIPHKAQRRSQQWPPVQKRKVNPHDKDEKALREKIKSWRCCRRGNLEETCLITSENIPDCDSKWSMKAKHEAKFGNNSVWVVYKEKLKKLMNWSSDKRPLEIVRLSAKNTAIMHQGAETLIMQFSENSKDTKHLIWLAAALSKNSSA